MEFFSSMDGTAWDPVAGSVGDALDVDFLLEDDSLLADDLQSEGNERGTTNDRSFSSGLGRAATGSQASVPLAPQWEWRCLHAHEQCQSCEPPPPVEEDRNWELVGDLVRCRPLSPQRVLLRSSGS